MEGENQGQQRQEQGEVWPDQGSGPDADTRERRAQGWSLRKGTVTLFNGKVWSHCLKVQSHCLKVQFNC